MSFLFLYIALALALLDWVAVARNWKRIRLLVKPGVIIALLVWMWQAAGFSGHLAWFAIGLLFSMAGDIFLVLPHERFIPALVSFLLAHLAYLIGFTSGFPPLNLASLFLALLVAITAGQVYRRIAASLEASKQVKLKKPVLVYCAMISLMLLSALFTLVRQENPQTLAQEAWLPGPALLASAGAMLFFLSDTFLAWNRFVDPLPFGKLRVIVTYHLGQAMIVLGAAYHFLSLT